jgi:hypothetical protein
MIVYASVQQLPRGIEELAFLGVTGLTAAAMQRIPRFAILGAAADAQIDK